jgi:hypothetical protein
LASTGAVEMSVFQRLLLLNGRKPPRLAFCPNVICRQEVLEPPVPPPPDPPEPPGPPDSEPPEFEPFPEPPPELDPVLQAVRIRAEDRTKAIAIDFQHEHEGRTMPSIFPESGCGGKRPLVRVLRHRDTSRGNGSISAFRRGRPQWNCAVGIDSIFEKAVTNDGVPHLMSKYGL